MDEFIESTVNAVAEVPAVEEQVADTGGVDTDTGTVATEQQEAAAPARQTKQENAEYANMRREIERMKRDNDLLTRATKQFFTGDTAEDLAYSAIAYAQGKDASEIRAAEQREAAEMAQRNSLQAELEEYRTRERERLIEDDVKAIRAIDPKVKTVDDLGDDFVKLRAMGIPAETAYNAIKAAMPKPPPSMGDISATSIDAAGEFFTEDQINSLSSKQLDNPKILEKAIRSLTKKK